VARGGAVDSESELKAWRSRDRFPDGVIGIFLWHNSSGRTMTLTASNSNEYQEYFLRG